MASSPSSSASPWLFAFATALKLLLIPSYRSTDFDVHRHWLALTHSLQADQWYTDTSSQWTLDYPPFFAHFSYLLSLPSTLFDGSLTSISHFNPSAQSIIFMRLTVIAADIMLLISVSLLRSSGDGDGSSRNRTLAAALTFLSPALLIVDHVHFQYNGFLLGLMMLSLALLEKGRDLSAGVVFAVLLCFKHLFLVAAPVYFVYLLRHFCFRSKSDVWKGVIRTAVMGSSVITVFIAAFGPFLFYGQMRQVLSRLFPFGRGLCHAYWAPNFWVFYIVVDKALGFVLTRLGFPVDTPEASFTGGLVGNSSSHFVFLPEVTPVVTFLLVLLAMSPCLVKSLLNPQPRHIVRWVAYACTCGFMFGWHVHEKASLHFTIPLGVIAMNSLDDARHFFMLSIVSCYSMFPLLFDRQEYPIKVLLLVFFAMIMWIGFSMYFHLDAVHVVNAKCSQTIPKRRGLVGPCGRAYLIGLVAVEVYSELIHRAIFSNKLPFLPLMMISCYCSVGMMHSWIWQLRYIIKHT